MAFRKILIANRGEIACRIIRTCKEMGLRTVAVYSDADRSALHVRMADEAYRLGPPPSRESYLLKEGVIAIARKSGADAIHPGYGFLAENPEFARMCAAAGLAFIGPPPASMEAMGEKTRARDRMQKAGVPVVPGTPGPVSSEADALRFAAEIGYPIMIKAAAGGGGKGMRKVEREADLPSALRQAMGEAQSAFGDTRVYLEKFLEMPRHVELQVFADQEGRCIHLGERECSVQRRHQKVVEETPSPIVDPALREAMGAIAVKAARAVSYVGAGTVEFLVDARRRFYFLEMNTRLQVEHPVTELVTGVDLVRWQIEIAQGAPLPFDSAPKARGHAIEARIYAEDPARGFMPCPGRIQYLGVPGGPFLRDDTGVYAGFEVPVFYDPMISKLSVWARTREEAIARLRRALSEYVVKGITTNIGYLQRVLAHEDFVSGRYDTGFLARRADELLAPEDPHLTEVAVLASAVYAYRRDQARSRASVGAEETPSAWKMAGRLSRLGRA
jgi:acetyl-CoA carboxylase biotin carboxylase subunit